jgi:hypothetical protein
MVGTWIETGRVARDEGAARHWFVARASPMVSWTTAKRSTDAFDELARRLRATAPGHWDAAGVLLDAGTVD